MPGQGLVGRVFTPEYKRLYAFYMHAVQYGRDHNVSVYENTLNHKYVILNKVKHKSCLSDSLRFKVQELDENSNNLSEPTIVNGNHLRAEFIPSTFSTSNLDDIKVNVFPAKRGLKVLGGYLCAVGHTGAACGGKILADSTNCADGLCPNGIHSTVDPVAGYTPPVPASMNDVYIMIASGINYITIFMNYGQPGLTWNKPGVWPTSAPQGKQQGPCPLNNSDSLNYYGTEGALPFENPENALKKLHEAGVTILVSIGSWDAVFPIAGIEATTNPPGKECITQIKDLISAPGAKKFVQMLRKFRSDHGNYIDGFDFDIEGFGAGLNVSKEGAWCPACNKNMQATPDMCTTWFSSNDLGAATDPTGCYNFPDNVTIDWLNLVFDELKNPTDGSIPLEVTMVPVSTALYSNDTSKPQNHYAYGLKFKNVDGIMLQWYSGSGINIHGYDVKGFFSVISSPTE